MSVNNLPTFACFFIVYRRVIIICLCYILLLVIMSLYIYISCTAKVHPSSACCSNRYDGVMLYSLLQHSICYVRCSCSGRETRLSWPLLWPKTKAKVQQSFLSSIALAGVVERNGHHCLREMSLYRGIILACSDKNSSVEYFAGVQNNYVMSQMYLITGIAFIRVSSKQPDDFLSVYLACSSGAADEYTIWTDYLNIFNEDASILCSLQAFLYD